jgi:hypothetical protein
MDTYLVDSTVTVTITSTVPCPISSVVTTTQTILTTNCPQCQPKTICVPCPGSQCPGDYGEYDISPGTSFGQWATYQVCFQCLPDPSDPPATTSYYYGYSGTPQQQQQQQPYTIITEGTLAYVVMPSTTAAGQATTNGGIVQFVSTAERAGHHKGSLMTSTFVVGMTDWAVCCGMIRNLLV